MRNPLLGDKQEQAIVESLLLLLDGKAYADEVSARFAGRFVEYDFRIKTLEDDLIPNRPSRIEVYERVACLLMEIAKTLR